MTAMTAFHPYIDIPDKKIGPIPIHPFGVLVATGVLVGSWLCVRRAEKYGVKKEKMESFISYILLFGFVLSHMLDMIMYRPKEIAQNPLELFMIWRGISSYGGFIGAVVGAFVYKFVKKEQILPYLDHVAAVFPVAWIFGRSGCSVAHDHPGRLSESFWAVDFGKHPPFGHRFDLGLLEMLITIPIALATLWFARKPRPTGSIVGFIALVYAPIRYPLDALRATDVSGADARYLGLTPGMWLSLILAGVGITLLVRGARAQKREDAEKARIASETPVDPVAKPEDEEPVASPSAP
jgi:phosphatidylglycerol:prolipoprotein diacylglycerol transferase